jgi:hypothetical protein
LNGSSWETIPGTASRVAVDPDGAAWVVNSAGSIFKYNLASKDWEQKAGTAKDVGVGADGSVWVVGTGAVEGGYGIYKWNGSGWTSVPGGAVRITVDPSGNAWIVNSTGNIFQYNGSSWNPKPGPAKDIGAGANGTIWCTGTNDHVYQWDVTYWKLKTGVASQIAVAPDGNALGVNAAGQVLRTTDASTTIKVIFPRGQTYEYEMLKALGFNPNGSIVNVDLNETSKLYSQLTPLEQAFGRLALLAAEITVAQEITANDNKEEQYDAQKLLDSVRNFNMADLFKKKVNGNLGGLVICVILKNSSDQSTVELKKWASDLFKSFKIRTSNGVLNEYRKWRNDPCHYKADGYEKPPGCVFKEDFTQLYGTYSPPSDIIGKAGLKSVLANNADAIASSASVGLAAITVAGSSIAVASGLGTLAASTIVNTTAAPIILSFTSLSAAFGGSGGIAGTAAGAIGATSWAGVVAAPVAAAVLTIVLGTMEGFRVVENAKVEPMLKMKLGAAMTEQINIVNVVSDVSGRDMFLLAFTESAAKGFQQTPPNVDGEARFYCQAGYVSKFKLSYMSKTVDKSTFLPQPKLAEFETGDLSVGQEKAFVIPSDATNIKIQGWYAAAGWKSLLDQSIAAPTYLCYTSYGTIFDAKYKTDCPEVSSMVAKTNALTVTHGGGYTAWVKLTYTQNGKEVVAQDQEGLTLGWRKVYAIPSDATNIRLTIKDATGVAWDPWKTVIDKTWPQPPSECIKVYGVTLNPQWNNECN